MNQLDIKKTGVLLDNLLETKSGKGGKLFIKDTRISVSFIVRCWRSGFGAEEIIAEYPNIPPAGVYAALAHYFANREVLDMEINAEIEEEKRLRFEYSQGTRKPQKEVV